MPCRPLSLRFSPPAPLPASLPFSPLPWLRPRRARRRRLSRPRPDRVHPTAAPRRPRPSRARNRRGRPRIDSVDRFPSAPDLAAVDHAAVTDHRRPPHALAGCPEALPRRHLPLRRANRAGALPLVRTELVHPRHCPTDGHRASSMRSPPSGLPVLLRPLRYAPGEDHDLRDIFVLFLPLCFAVAPSLNAAATAPARAGRGFDQPFTRVVARPSPRPVLATTPACSGSAPA